MAFLRFLACLTALCLAPAVAVFMVLVGLTAAVSIAIGAVVQIGLGYIMSRFIK